MPLLDSFTVDHTRMEAPAVRVAKKMNTPHGDEITVFDLRFCVPNQEVMPERGIHTLEHLFAGFMRDHLNGNGVEIIDISDGLPHRVLYEPDRYAGRAARRGCLESGDGRRAEGERSESDPGAERLSVRNHTMHSLEEAQEIARHIIERDVRVNSNDELALPKENCKNCTSSASATARRTASGRYP